MLPIGYRDTENDWLVSLKKVRKSREDLITEIDQIKNPLQQDVKAIRVWVLTQAVLCLIKYMVT